MRLLSRESNVTAQAAHERVHACVADAVLVQVRLGSAPPPPPPLKLRTSATKPALTMPFLCSQISAGGQDKRHILH